MMMLISTANVDGGGALLSNAHLGQSLMNHKEITYRNA